MGQHVFHLQIARLYLCCAFFEKLIYIKVTMAVSKNNPNARKAAIEKTFKGKKVKPVKYIGTHGTYIAAQDEESNMIVSSSGIPIPFKKLDQYA
jgi:hypothetical protein